MSAQPPHRVLRLVLDLQTPPAADVRALQDAVQRVLYIDWLPLVEQACNTQGQPGLVQRIDTLVLDLGHLPAQALLAAAGQGGPTQPPGPAWPQGSPPVNNDFSQHLRAALGRALQTASVVQTDLELVAFFLHTGALPWWADVADRHVVQRAALALLQGQPLDWRPLLGAADAPNIGRLVAALHSATGAAPVAGADTALARLLDLQLQPGPGGAWPAAQHQAWWVLLAQAAVVLGRPLPALRSAWWCAALASQLATRSTGPTSATSATSAGSLAQPVLAWLPLALQRTAAALGLPAAALPQALHRLLQQHPASPGLVRSAVPVSLRDWLAGQAADGMAPAVALGASAGQPAAGSAAGMALAASRPSAAGQAANTNHLAHAAQRADAASGRRRETRSTAQPPQQSSGQQAAAQPASHLADALQHGQADALQHGQADALYIHNAGLVWLWPFLPRFFERLGLWRQRQWVAPGAAQRAALLLQCAASGDAEPPEFQLLLNKLLCGLPLDAALHGSGLAGAVHQAPLSAAEQDECEALLVATIAQAPILHAMSVAGFRGTFVLRGGQLSGRDGHPLLRVERSSYDLVLDRFPWGVSIVRLPWMVSLLQVQW